MSSTLQVFVDAENQACVTVAEAFSTGEAFNPYHKWLGVRGCKSAPDHYRLLGVGLFEDDPEVIDNAADQRLMFLGWIRWSLNGDRRVVCNRLVSEIIEARACLANLAAKEEYDCILGGRIGSDWLLREDDDEEPRVDSSAESGMVGDTTASSAYEVSLPTVESSLLELRRLRCRTEAAQTFRAVAYAAMLYALVGWGIILFRPWSFF